MSGHERYALLLNLLFAPPIQLYLENEMIYCPDIAASDMSVCPLFFPQIELQFLAFCVLMILLQISAGVLDYAAIPNKAAGAQCMDFLKYRGYLCLAPFCLKGTNICPFGFSYLLPSSQVLEVMRHPSDV